MKATAIIALLLCFAFVLSIALTGCGKNKEVEVPDDGRGDLSSGQQDIVPPPVGDENGDEIEDNSSNPATPQKPGSSTQQGGSSSQKPVTPQKPGSSSQTTRPTTSETQRPSSSSQVTPPASSSSSQKPSSSSQVTPPASSSSSQKPSSSAPSSSSKPATSSNSGISTERPPGALDMIV